MSYIIELLQVSLTIFFIIVFVLNKKSKFFIITYPIAILVCCCIDFFSSCNNFILYPPIYFLLYFLYPLLFSKVKVKITLYISIFSLCFISIVNSLVNMFLYHFFLPTVDMLPTFITTSILFIICFVILLLNKKLIYAVNKLFNISTAINIFIILFLFLFFIMLSFENSALLLLPNKNLTSLLSFISVILLSACSVAIAYLIISNYKKIYYQKTNETLNKNIEQQIKHYENTIRAYDNLRTFKHDYNNLKIGLTSLLKENKTDEAIKYLNDFNNITGNDTVIKTGNTVVDAIISDKSSDLQRHNINISFTGIIPYDAMNISDLCIAFGNALDNAIEACIKMQLESAKNISVEVHQVNNLLIIKMTNPVFQKVEINNNTANTSKDDPLSHGIGIYSISTTVQKYNGYYKIDCNDTDFTLEMGFFI